MTQIEVKEGRQTVTIDVEKFKGLTKIYCDNTSVMSEILDRATIPATDEIKAGDYVVYEHLGDRLIVLVSVLDAKHNEFSGQVIQSKSALSQVGEYSDNWVIDSFRKFYGTITIKCS